MYTNVRGLKGKITSLTSILNENSPQVFLLTETQLRSNTGINIPNYTFFGRKREGKVEGGGGVGGGVGILIRNDIKSYIATHTTHRNIEIIWISIRRRQLPPLIIGSYYGRQETRTSKDEIDREMTLLEEEITEMKKDGEIILAMDGNGKIGILGEEKSRNGKALLRTFDNTDLKIMNLDEKCKGKITRKNTKNTEEISAIDFVVASQQAESWINHMTIDEEELMKVKGKNDTDHNTILLDITIPNIHKTNLVKRVVWNIHASNEKWNDFASELRKRQQKATEIIKDESMPFDIKYKQVTRGYNDASTCWLACK